MTHVELDKALAYLNVKTSGQEAPLRVYLATDVFSNDPGIIVPPETVERWLQLPPQDHLNEIAGDVIALEREFWNSHATCPECGEPTRSVQGFDEHVLNEHTPGITFLGDTPNTRSRQNTPENETFYFRLDTIDGAHAVTNLYGGTLDWIGPGDYVWMTSVMDGDELIPATILSERLSAEIARLESIRGSLERFAKMT